MRESICVNVSTNLLNIQDAYNFVIDPTHGALSMFVGTVRNHHEGNNVQGITYDVHEALTEKTFQEICLETQNLWKGIKIYISHYKGQLDVGGISVIIAIGSAHRSESFEACRYIIEALKKRAPVWKQEHYEDGPSEWLPGHNLQGTTVQLDEQSLGQDNKISSSADASSGNCAKERFDCAG